MKALWVLDLQKQLNGNMLLNYITLGYTNNFLKKTETFYTNILSLPAGHYLTIQPSAEKLQMKRWYDLKYELRNTNNQIITESEAIEKFKELFKISINRRLRSDVKIGTSLSGGIDSSSIVAVSQQFSSTHLSHQCFTAIFPDFEKDESIKSKQVADHFKLQQHTIEPTVEDWIGQWQTLTYHQEEPLQSSSVLTQFMLYRLAKKNGIKVLLDGQGADEILGGYKKHSHCYLQQLLRSDFFSYKKEKKILQQHHFLENWNYKNYAAALFPEKAANHLQQKAIAQQNHQSFIQKDFLQQYQNKNSLQKPVIKSLEDILYFDTVHSGLSSLLRYADRNAMANSIEVRLPFLFHELVEFIFSLPSSFKIKDGYTKWILRKSMNDLLPNNITWQTNKIGYEPPQQKWMHNIQIQEMIQESKRVLVNKHILSKQALDQNIQPLSAHEANNFDFRYLSAAAMFTPNP
jgi:asparagine synthase (glutamine-hydrolysing)